MSAFCFSSRTRRERQPRRGVRGSRRTRWRGPLHRSTFGFSPCSATRQVRRLHEAAAAASSAVGARRWRPGRAASANGHAVFRRLRTASLFFAASVGRPHGDDGRETKTLRAGGIRKLHSLLSGGPGTSGRVQPLSFCCV